MGLGLKEFGKAVIFTVAGGLALSGCASSKEIPKCNTRDSNFSGASSDTSSEGRGIRSKFKKTLTNVEGPVEYWDDFDKGLNTDQSFICMISTDCQTAVQSATESSERLLAKKHEDEILRMRTQYKLAEVTGLLEKDQFIACATSRVADRQKAPESRIVQEKGKKNEVFWHSYPAPTAIDNKDGTVSLRYEDPVKWENENPKAPTQGN